MTPQLVLVSEPGDGETFELHGPSVSLGTEAEADVCVAWGEPGVVAPLHVRLEERDGQWALVNEAESLGTFLNGRKIGGRHVLRDGDEIELGLGGPRFRFQLTERAPTCLATTVPVMQKSPVVNGLKPPMIWFHSWGLSKGASGGRNRRLLILGLLSALVLLAALAANYLLLLGPQRPAPAAQQVPANRSSGRPETPARPLRAPTYPSGSQSHPARESMRETPSKPARAPGTSATSRPGTDPGLPDSSLIDTTTTDVDSVGLRPVQRSVTAASGTLGLPGCPPAGREVSRDL